MKTLRLFQPDLPSRRADHTLKVGQVARTLTPIAHIKQSDQAEQIALADLLRKRPEGARFAIAVAENGWVQYAWCDIWSKDDQIPPVLTIEGRDISRHIHPNSK